jgi:diacylglycerol O-acyltransferase / wax synthase
VQRLSGLDAGFLYMETPTLLMHTLKVVVLDPGSEGVLDFDGMREQIRGRMPRLPSFRRRVVEVPFGFHHPVWVEDPDFDLDYHVRRVVLRPPGTKTQLDEVIANLAGIPLDRTRPLWRMYVLEGLEGGRLAVLAKIHHAVADGSAASALLANVMSMSSLGETVHEDRWVPEELPSARRLLRTALRDHLTQLVHLPGLVGRTGGNVRSVLRHRRRSKVATPVPILDTPRTEFNGALGTTRSFATTVLSFPDARTVKRAFGVTLNDVVLGVVSGALRRYLIERGCLPERPLVAGIPVGTDSGSDRLVGNRVSNMFTSLATDLDDPVERLLAINEVTAEAKTLQQLIGVETFRDWVQYTPPRPYAWFMRQYSRRRIADRHAPPINLVVSNVPGPSERLFAAGVPLQEIYSVGPVLEGIGLNITVWSYLDRLYVGALACREALPDLHLVTDAMPETLDALMARASEGAVVASGA